MIAYYMNKKFLKITLSVIVGLILFGGGMVTYKIMGRGEVKGTIASPTKQDEYVKFVMEVYDKITEHYWEKTTGEELGNLFLLAYDKLTGIAHSLQSKDRIGIEKLTSEVLGEVGKDKKKELVTKATDMVLANLKPFGRSRLYSLKEEKSLNNTVNNVNPEANHLEALGVKKDATDKEIAQAYEKKVVETAKDPTKQAEVKRAFEVLKNEDSRKVYAVSGVEPTIEYKLMSPSIFYVRLTKFSPTSLEEFVRTVNKVDSGTELDTLIFDLRGNIGGAIDSLPYFLGPFIGGDNYAYQFYRQGMKEDYKTKTGWLNSMVRYKKVVILIDGESQSSAEVMAAAMKKYNVGVVLGEKTKGWGTVERVIPLETQIEKDEKFSLFMVHRVTVRDDGQLIEGNGVEPTVSIKDPQWRQKLMQYYNRSEIVKAVEEIYKGQ